MINLKKLALDYNPLHLAHIYSSSLNLKEEEKKKAAIADEFVSDLLMKYRQLVDKGSKATLSEADQENLELIDFQLTQFETMPASMMLRCCAKKAFIDEFYLLLNEEHLFITIH